MPAAMALFAPYVNSYRRLSPLPSAPINVHWGYDNRTGGHPRADVRRRRRGASRTASAAPTPIPTSRIAATLACGYLGMIEGAEAVRPDRRQRLRPAVRAAAHARGGAALLRECEPLVDLLGEPFVQAFTAVKEAEYEMFLQVISSWEREHLLLNV